MSLCGCQVGCVDGELCAAIGDTLNDRIFFRKRKTVSVDPVGHCPDLMADDSCGFWLFDTVLLHHRGQCSPEAMCAYTCFVATNFFD